MQTKATLTVHVVLPAFNEAENLVPLLTSFQEVVGNDSRPYIFHLIDDGSSDRTVEVAKSFSSVLTLKVLQNGTNRGLSYTLKSGLESALAHAAGDDIILCMDADNTHLPVQVPDMLTLIEQGADIVIASRYRRGAKIEGLSKFRKLLSILASTLFIVVIPIKGVRDYSCGFRAVKAKLLKEVFTAESERIFAQKGFACTTALLLALTRKKTVIVKEIPMLLKYGQKRGVSKMRVSQTSFASLKLIKDEWVLRRSLSR